MSKYDELIEQLYDGSFRDMMFTVYNFIDNDGYVREMSAIRNEKMGIEDFSFMMFDIPASDKTAIKSNNRETIQKYNDFKYYIEKECQKILQIGIFVMKEFGVVIAVKPKHFDLSSINTK